VREDLLQIWQRGYSGKKCFSFRGATWHQNAFSGRIRKIIFILPSLEIKRTLTGKYDVFCMYYGLHQGVNLYNKYM
jgi:hypothetical protein